MCATSNRTLKCPRGNMQIDLSVKFSLTLFIWSGRINYNPSYSGVWWDYSRCMYICGTVIIIMNCTYYTLYVITSHYYSMMPTHGNNCTLWCVFTAACELLPGSVCSYWQKTDFKKRREGNLTWIGSSGSFNKTNRIPHNKSGVKSVLSGAASLQTPCSSGAGRTSVPPCCESVMKGETSMNTPRGSLKSCAFLGHGICTMSPTLHPPDTLHLSQDGSLSLCPPLCNCKLELDGAAIYVFSPERSQPLTTVFFFYLLCMHMCM